jgi:hypothetical protein
VHSFLRAICLCAFISACDMFVCIHLSCDMVVCIHLSCDLVVCIHLSCDMVVCIHLSCDMVVCIHLSRICVQYGCAHSFLRAICLCAFICRESVCDMFVFVRNQSLSGSFLLWAGNLYVNYVLIY